MADFRVWGSSMTILEMPCHFPPNIQQLFANQMMLAFLAVCSKRQSEIACLKSVNFEI
jgi:hypothetical protein